MRALEQDGLSYRELSRPEEMAAVVALELEIWGPDDATPANQLVISVKAGGHVLGAFDGERLVAFAYGFPAVLPGREPWLASHMLATLRAYDGRGIGRTLKWLQRTWCLERGFRRVTWTFDPLEARNCHLNLNVLGATAPEYHVNCYGVMQDKLNHGLPSDRFMAHWDLESARVLAARAGRLKPQDGVRVAIPPDFQAIKRESLERALEVRLAVREALASRLAQGLEVSGFDRAASELLLTARP